MDAPADRVVRLHAERRALRAEGVPVATLERNRRALVEAHRTLRTDLGARRRAA